MVESPQHTAFVFVVSLGLNEPRSIGMGQKGVNLDANIPTKPPSDRWIWCASVLLHQNAKISVGLWREKSLSSALFKVHRIKLAVVGWLPTNSTERSGYSVDPDARHDVGPMISPIIICDGMIRSGSTWSFNVCRCLGLLLAKRRTQSFGTAYLWQQTLDDFFRTRVNLGDGPMVIKAHEVGPVALEWIRAGRAKAVCTIRDPRDCVASDIHYWKAGFDASVQRVNVSLQSLHKSYQDFGRTIFVRYEEMMADPLWQIRRIAVDLGIEVNQAEVQWVHAQTNIQVSQKICRELRDRPQNQVNIEPTGLRCDPVSLLHENHIDSGKVGRWKMDLTPEQGQTLTGMFSISLRALGYEGGEEAISPLHGFIPADTHATNISAAPLT